MPQPVYRVDNPFAPGVERIWIDRFGSSGPSSTMVPYVRFVSIGHPGARAVYVENPEEL